MSYEPGSPECRSLIEAKDSILRAVSALNKIKEAESQKLQLMNIYNVLEEMHDIRRAKESKLIN